MASTRNRNFPGNYCQEQKQYQNNEKYTLYENSSYGNAYDTRWAGNGLNPGQIPANQMASNSVQIESFLFGINSTNMVSPGLTSINPKFIQLNTANIFQKDQVLLPKPFVLDKRQRPFPVP